MKEIIDNSGEFHDPEPNNGKRGGMNRRDFIRAGGAIAASIAAGTGLGLAIRESQKSEEGEAKNHERQGQGMIIEKSDQPGSITPFVSGGRMPVVGVIPHPEQWHLIVQVGNDKRTVKVTKEEFNAYKVGEQVSVKYDDRNLEAKSVEKLGGANKK